MQSLENAANDLGYEANRVYSVHQAQSGQSVAALAVRK